MNFYFHCKVDYYDEDTNKLERANFIAHAHDFSDLAEKIKEYFGDGVDHIDCRYMSDDGEFLFVPNDDVVTTLEKYDYYAELLNSEE